ncbi:MAG: HAMP domain-containing protein [Candidatus Rokubacteria bacterium]|nr:HAMP domain-containing protein [Candidatus Rokubacteria bacterium]
MIGVRHKLLLVGALVILFVSVGFTWLNLALAQRAIQEDLKARAIVYAREVAATFGDRRELEGSEALQRLIGRLRDIRRSVLQLDVLGFGPAGTTVLATSAPAARLPFDRRDAEVVRRGRVVARAVTAGTERYWEVMAPIAFDGTVAGAVALKFSTMRADELASRIRFWAITLTGGSVLLMGLLVSAAVHVIVDRPMRRFMDAIGAAATGGVPAAVDVRTSDEFGRLAERFNEMVARITRFNEELRTRIAEATGELDRRYQQVEQLNALLFEMQRRLNHAERLALAGRVMAEVAHEVGTPLHSVAGHLELLRKDLPGAAVTGDVARRLGIIESQVTRVIEIINRLLDVTRRAPAKPGPVDLEGLVRDTAELVRPGLANAGVALDVRAESGLPAIRGQQDQLQQVVLNLLTNAIDATPAGGRIEVTTLALLGREEVQIVVADSGPGIPEADRKKIFDPFFSTKDGGRGAGLGLFITAEIVREHKGRIDVGARDGGGSVFRVTLPVGTGAA